jgi:hypothetical protein
MEQTKEERKKSILAMAGGGIMERVDYEMTKLVENILDPNTKATAPRTLTLTIKIIPDDQRQVMAVQTVAKSTLATTNPIVTAMYLTQDENNQPCAVEMTKQNPGQIRLDGSEQEPPALLRLVK